MSLNNNDQRMNEEIHITEKDMEDGRVADSGQTEPGNGITMSRTRKVILGGVMMSTYFLAVRPEHLQ